MQKLVLRTEESPSMKLLTCWQFNCGQFRAFGKRVWLCFWLPPNMSPACRWGGEGEAWQHVSGLSLEASRDPEFPCDIFHFLKLKMALKRRFSDNTVIKQHCRCTCLVSDHALHKMLWTILRLLHLL